MVDKKICMCVLQVMRLRRRILKTRKWTEKMILIICIVLLEEIGGKGRFIIKTKSLSSQTTWIIRLLTEEIHGIEVLKFLLIYIYTRCRCSIFFTVPSLLVLTLLNLCCFPFNVVSAFLRLLVYDFLYTKTLLLGILAKIAKFCTRMNNVINKKNHTIILHRLCIMYQDCSFPPFTYK